MPLRYLFIDMNAYFASVEQHLRPELRGHPVAVVPTLADTTCCIAASYEAKRFGVKTGTLVREARRLCPGLRIVEARPHHYVTIHRRLVEAVESCLPVGAILSIDEMTCPLVGSQREPDRARQLAVQVKAAIARRVGQQLRCSIGLAPNTMLAKVAADMRKPDGLTMLRSEDLPQRLYELAVTDFPGIGARLQQRFQRYGVSTVQQLCELSQQRLAAIWGSRILAERWWRRLRGEDVSEPPTRRGSVSHSRVLPPAARNDEAARAVLVGLLHKAAARLRQLNYHAGSLTVSVAFAGAPSWSERRHLTPCRDTLTLLEVLRPLWQRKPAGTPLQVGVILGHLQGSQNLAQSLFEEDRHRESLADAMDRLNEQFGPQAVYFAGMHRTEAAAPTRIAFTNIPDV